MQRATEYLGKTRFEQFHLELKKDGEMQDEEVQHLLKDARTYYQQSLELCDRLSGRVGKHKLLKMTSVLSMVLGMAYEKKIEDEDAEYAKLYAKKALKLFQ